MDYRYSSSIGWQIYGAHLDNCANTLLCVVVLNVGCWVQGCETLPPIFSANLAAFSSPCQDRFSHKAITAFSLPPYLLSATSIQCICVQPSICKMHIKNATPVYKQASTTPVYSIWLRTSRCNSNIQRLHAHFSCNHHLSPLRSPFAFTPPIHSHC